MITERELLHNLAFEVAELREHVAGLHTRLERFELVRELDSGRHSRRVDAAIPPRAALLELVGNEICPTCGHEGAVA